jgi:hypothetical protein
MVIIIFCMLAYTQKKKLGVKMAEQRRQKHYHG